jgi:predicted PurR-regulated permease PerM
LRAPYVDGLSTVPTDQNSPFSRDQLAATLADLTLRLGLLALLLYWSFLLVQPFIPIMIWSVVLTVALYPLYEWMVSRLGGRRRLAAALLTLLSLLIVIGPATWLVLSLIDSMRTLSDKLDLSALSLPPPPISVKGWPLVGNSLYQFWELASTNLQEAFAKIVPQLKPLGGVLLQIAAGAGTGTIKFLVAVIVAGFLFSPAPMLADKLKILSRKVASGRGEEFVQLAGGTIQAVSRGVIGISALQALFAGLGILAIGIPGASLITSAVLVLGIMQIGPSIILIPLIVWSWFATETTTAVLFTAYMIPVGLLDNVLKPLVMGRGLDVPMMIILIGVIGGTISNGITGLFLGPIVLSVFWKLFVAWLKESDKA